MTSSTAADAAAYACCVPDGVSTEFPAMGTTAHVVLTGPHAPPLERTVQQLEELESAWSRFRPASELSRLGADDAGIVAVSHVTAMLVERAVWAWRRTGGRFDPTVGAALRAAGYDRNFEDLGPVATRGASAPPPGCDGIEVSSRADLVTVPPGVTIDPGGIGKGLAADLAATRAVDHGATGALVSVGGDLRVAGEAPTGGWEIEVDHHLPATARVNLRSGALATSTTLRRRWSTTDGVAHHVIDPRIGRPSDGPVVACSVVAAEAWWAEALATALLVGWRSDADHVDLLELLDGCGALVTFADGEQRSVGPLGHVFSLGRNL